MQKEYKMEFGEELVIDFYAMKGSPDIAKPAWIKKLYVAKPISDPIKIHKLIDDLCIKHDIDIADVRVKKVKSAEKSAWIDKYRDFMVELSIHVMEKRMHQSVAADYINKNRTTFSHYYHDKPVEI